MNSNNKKIIRNLLIYLGIPILLVVLLLLLFDRGADQTGLKYSDVLSYFEDGKVSAYSLNLGTGEMKLTVTEDSSKKESVVRYTVPNVNLFYNDVSDYIKSYNEEHPNNRMTQDVIRPAETSWLVSLIPTLLMIALLVAFWVFMMKRMGGGGAGNQMNFGKAKVKQINDEKRRTTFADVAGADEEKEELREIVEFLKRPNKYNELGARIPKGVLLVGPPGTGKTLLARAVAAKPACRSSPFRVPTSWRCSSASVHRVCVTCSTKPRKTTRASSSSMKSMPWAASAVRVSAAATTNVSRR